MNADLRLKLRMRRLLWLQGYHCPLEIDLSHYEFEDGQSKLKRTPLTDIDVLGVRFEPDLRSTLIIADCKSGRESEPNRLFWLRGVMDFFGAREGIFVKTAIHSHAKALAPKLGVRVLDEKGLAVLEQSLATKAPQVPVDDATIYTDTQKLWGIDVAPRQKPNAQQLILKDVYQYLQYVYWVTEEYRNIQTIIEKFSQVSDDLQPNRDRDKYIVHIGLQRLTLSVLRMAEAIAARGFSDVRLQSRLYLFGGPFLLRERTEMIELLDQFREQNNLSGDKLSILPPYFDELVEIMNRILIGSGHAARMLQHLDAVLLESVFGPKGDIEVVLGATYSTNALVLVKRIAAMFQEHAGFHKDLLAELWQL